MAEKCFALKSHEEYFENKNECYALSWPAFRKMIKIGACCTLRCPFYKPNRKQVRLRDEIIDKRKV